MRRVIINNEEYNMENYIKRAYFKDIKNLSTNTQCTQEDAKIIHETIHIKDYDVVIITRETDAIKMRDIFIHKNKIQYYRISLDTDGLLKIYKRYSSQYPYEVTGHKDQLYVDLYDIELNSIKFTKYLHDKKDMVVKIDLIDNHMENVKIVDL